MERQLFTRDYLSRNRAIPIETRTTVDYGDLYDFNTVSDNNDGSTSIQRNDYSSISTASHQHYDKSNRSTTSGIKKYNGDLNYFNTVSDNNKASTSMIAQDDSSIIIESNQNNDKSRITTSEIKRDLDTKNEAYKDDNIKPCKSVFERLGKTDVLKDTEIFSDKQVDVDQKDKRQIIIRTNNDGEKKTNNTNTNSTRKRKKSRSPITDRELKVRRMTPSSSNTSRSNTTQLNDRYKRREEQQGILHQGSPSGSRSSARFHEGNECDDRKGKPRNYHRWSGGQDEYHGTNDCNTDRLRSTSYRRRQSPYDKSSSRRQASRDSSFPGYRSTDHNSQDWTETNEMQLVVHEKQLIRPHNEMHNTMATDTRNQLEIQSQFRQNSNRGENGYMARSRTHAIGDFPRHRREENISSKTLDIDRLSKMDNIILGEYLCSHKNLVENFMKKEQNDQILKFIKTVSRVCCLEMSYVMEPLKNIFERSDVREAIFDLREKTFEQTEYDTLNNLLTLMKGLVYYADGRQIQLSPILDSLDLCVQQQCSNDLDATTLLKDLIKSIRDKWYQHRLNQTIKKHRELSILPDISEINSPQLFCFETYYKKSEEEYLKRLFLVHRQDFIRPLCQGLSCLQEDLRRNSNFKWVYDDIRIYENVEILFRCCNEQNGLTWRIGFDVSRYSGINWEARKLLIYGSLVCLTNKEFTFILYGTVADRKSEDLKKGLLEIKFNDEDSALLDQISKETDLFMVESQAFYPCYFNTLNSLRQMFQRVVDKKEKLPFGDQLVLSQENKDLPNYLVSPEYQTIGGFDLSCINPELETVDISKPSNWPSASSLQLDDSQYAALVTSMASRLTLIQGPPGTGKTVVGLKIAELFLYNENRWRSKDKTSNGPMLLLSYTNHALDQFILELCKKMPTLKGEDIVRLGSRSDVEELTKYNLSFHRKDKYSYGTIMVGRRRRKRLKQIRTLTNEFNANAFEAKKKLSEMVKSHQNLHKMKEELLTGIVHQNWFFNTSDVMSKQHISHLKENDAFVKWLELPNILTSDKCLNTNQFEDKEFEYCDLDNDRRDALYDDLEDVEHTSFSWLDFDCLQMTFSTKYLFSDQYKQGNSNFWDQYNYYQKVLFMHNLRNKLRKTNRMTGEESYTFANVWMLNNNKRWGLYKYWLTKSLEPIEMRIREIEKEYKTAQRNYKRYQNIADRKILTRAKLIACTTTRASHDIDLLRAVCPKIILLEEAAEIPEHHVVACLTPSCQQIIMIGDHQQLRPAFNDYKTAREHKINISFFERLINAGYPCRRLEYQHRMRPTISKLIVPHIYQFLKDDKVVDLYEKEQVRGMKNNLFFISHTENEDNEREKASRSHRNKHEANFITGLYRYLRMQSYTAGQITILCPYIDQVRLLKSGIKNVDIELSRILPDASWQSETVRVTTVDNFQGEENDIILLSLVRSNVHKTIGHLRENNRICVALSRAKIGFYVIGNMDMMRAKSPLWENIIADTSKRGFLGDTLELVCQNHKSSTFVKNLEDFQLLEDGGCQIVCKTRKDCGHLCSRKCHVDDVYHRKRCKKTCNEELCERGHKCEKECHFPVNCGLCEKMVEKELPQCGHKKCMPCHKNASLGQCDLPCERNASCKYTHPCKMKCSDVCNTAENCNELIKAKARCGHDVQVACHKECYPPCYGIHCEEILECGHSCAGNCTACSQGRLHAPCKKPCKRTLVCGHLCPENCNYKCSPCKKRCTRSCSHGVCKRRCGEKCIKCREPCDWECKKGCPNQYKCTEMCYKQCDRPKCNTPCHSILSCGHKCAGLHCETKCIQLCKVCDKKKLTDIFFGTEEDRSAIFIQLEDCWCVFEVTGLDQYIEGKIKDKEKEDITSLKCPRCQTPITKSSRYRNELKSINKDVEEIFENIRNSNVVDLHTKRSDALNALKRVKNDMDDVFYEKQCKTVGKATGTNDLDLIIDQASFVHEITTRIKDFPINEFPFLKAWLNHLKEWVWQSRKRFSNQEHREVRLEVRRLQLIFDIHKFEKELVRRGNGVQELPEGIKLNLGKLESAVKVADQDISVMRRELDETSSQLIGLTIEEKIMIKQVMATEFTGSGHWYRCSNGHYYSIGECGMPMEQRKCPQCDVTIGGINHLLTENNERAMDMETL